MMDPSFRRVALAVGVAMTFACADQSWRREPPAMPEQMQIVFPLLECVRVGQGPRICVVELPHSPIVALSVSLSVGARHDPADAPGTAEGTIAALLAARDEQGVPVLETSLGELGGPVVALVSAEGASLSTFTLPQRLAPALRILTDAVMAPQLGQQATGAARADQCRAATEVLGDPDTLAHLAMRRALLPKRHPGALPALRTQICQEPLDAARAVELARQFIVPANVAVLVAGPVKTDEVVQFVTQLTSAWTPPTRAAPSRPAVPDRDPTITIVDIPGLSQTVITVGGMTRPGRPADDPALVLALDYAGSEVYAGLRRDLGATYGVSSRLVAAEDRALWMLTTRVDTAATAGALKELSSRLRFLGDREIDESSVFTSGVHTLTRAMRSFAIAVDAIALLAAQHRAGAAIEQTIDRARNLRAVDPEDLGRLVGETFAPAAAQFVLVGDAAALSQLPALRGARVVRPISVLDG